jgi:HSP90 family molecular chaperone
MSLVEEKYIESTDGIKKTIDKGSMGMALDILQRGLYAHPIQSTVRELASNSYDAVKEREVAKAILSGTTQVEDHFDVTKINGVFHSSGWDPSYFDLNWLSDDPSVYLYYDEGNQKDTLRIVDHGVGLGKTRLVNYFMLNWSSKRANKDALGKFGLIKLELPNYYTIIKIKLCYGKIQW